MNKGLSLDTMSPLGKKFPVRSCISCRRKDYPSALIRVTLVDGKVIPDIKTGAPGRGAWLHMKCAEVAIDRNAFVYAFKTNKAHDQAIDVSELLKFLEGQSK